MVQDLEKLHKLVKDNLSYSVVFYNEKISSCRRLFKSKGKSYSLDII